MKEKEPLKIYLKKNKSKNGECNSFLFKWTTRFEKLSVVEPCFSLNRERRAIDFFFSVSLSHIDMELIKNIMLSKM